MSIQLETALCQMFNIRYPLVLAGMAGGPSTVKLVAAVSNSGGLGTLGAAYMEPTAIREAILEIRQLTQAPFAVNLFSTHAADITATKEKEKAQNVLNLMRDALEIPHMTEVLAAAPDLIEEQLTIAIEAKVSVISTTFGVLPESLMKLAKSAGMRVVTMVTTVQEALFAEHAGCDAIVAQGSEAGGHRGTFDMLEYPLGSNVGTFALVPQIVDQVKIPVIAAGGIMDGRGLVAALALGALGAQGVQMGTRFLTASESGTHASYKQALLESTEESTVLTKAFSGRPARGVLNKFIRQWDASAVQPLPFPTQNTMTLDIRNAAARQHNADYMSLWAGQGTRLLTSGQTAENIVAETIHQAHSILS